MKISQPSPVLGFPRTTVFNAASPLAWTDLDLSAVVGARSALVVLKMEVIAAAVHEYAMRRNGDSGVYYSIQGASRAHVTGPATRAAYLVVPTDSAGIVEHWASANDNITVTVEGYLAI